MIGERLPLLVTAAGRAYLSACSAAERDALLEIAGTGRDASARAAPDAAYVARVLRETRRRGYAFNDGEWSGQASFSAIAVPVESGGRPIAAVSLIFPKGALSIADLEARYLPPLARLARAIGRRRTRRPYSKN
jgi:IclR family mhp operon transcriptional activator